MNIRKPLILAISALLLFALYPQQSWAENFTGAKFLEWSKASQDSYIRTSVGMAAMIGSQVDDEKADCIGDWYFSDTTAQHDALRKSMREHARFHPQAVILAVIEKACGPF